MGTRGLTGFVHNEQEKLTYVHWDSYPDGLGVDVLDWLRGQDIGQLTERVEALELVEQDSKPTAAQVAQARAAGTVDLGVSHQSEDDWYCLLRGAQGDLGKLLEVGVMIDSHEFALDSLFCEWGYIIDLDESTFEVYQGFQKDPNIKGRFADRNPYIPDHRKDQPVEYYPITLVGSHPLNDLPSNEAFVAALRDDEDEA